MYETIDLQQQQQQQQHAAVASSSSPAGRVCNQLCSWLTDYKFFHSSSKTPNLFSLVTACILG
jgi:hypothetical protein